MAYTVSYCGLPIDGQNDLAYIGESAAMQRDLSSQSTNSDHQDFYFSSPSNMLAISNPQLFLDQNIPSSNDPASHIHNLVKPCVSIPAIAWEVSDYCQKNIDLDLDNQKFDLNQPPYSVGSTFSPMLNQWQEMSGTIDLSRSTSNTSYVTGSGSHFSAEMARMYSNSSFSSVYEDGSSCISPSTNVGSPLVQSQKGNSTMTQVDLPVSNNIARGHGHRLSVSSQYSTSSPSELLSPQSHSMARTISNRSYGSTASSPQQQVIKQEHKPHNLPVRPKDVTTNISPTTGPSMVRIRSSDGSSRQVGVLPRRAPPVDNALPAAPKLLCSHCDRAPQGFRGEHELQRHVNLYHQARRKAWICVDSSPDHRFLSQCRACTEGKAYGAYYNAAAHLRRVHFEPRIRGAKTKNGVSRAGKAGGNKPPMETIKRDWLKEIEVDNPPTSSRSKRQASARAAPGDILVKEQSPEFHTNVSMNPALGAPHDFDELMANDVDPYPAATPAAWSVPQADLWARRQAGQMGFEVFL